jgi:hypothetical protein
MEAISLQNGKASSSSIWHSNTEVSKLYTDWSENTMHKNHHLKKETHDPLFNTYMQSNYKILCTSHWVLHCTIKILLMCIGENIQFCLMHIKLKSHSSVNSRTPILSQNIFVPKILSLVHGL